jgi:hypothetical protein
MPQPPAAVPAEVLHAGDRIVITRNGQDVPVRLTTVIHGSDMVSNIVILGCQPDSGAPPMTLPFPADAMIDRVWANRVTAA